MRKGPIGTGKDLLERSTSSSYKPIPTFIRLLDDLLGGGIQSGLVTELVGDSGVGKTAFCIQLCMNVQIPRVLNGPESQALFIDTENTFVVQRAKEIAKAFVMHCNSVIPDDYRSVVKVSESKLLSGIHVVKCKHFLEFENIILSLDDFISRNRKIRLLIIDSIAFPFYTQGDSFHSRSKPLYSVGQVLHYLAERYGIAIVITNKLTPRFDKKGEEYFVPYLGESWFHVPNQRLQLYWSKTGNARVAEIVKSSHAAPGKVYYKVTPAGIRS